MNNKNFKDFIDEVSTKIREHLAENLCNCNIGIKNVTKNNGLLLTGIYIQNPDSRVTPIVYLNGFYERYRDGQPMDDIIEDIIKNCIDNRGESLFNIEDFSDFNAVKDKIRPKLISKEWNKEILKNAVYTELLNLAVIYQVCLHETDEGNIS